MSDVALTSYKYSPTHLIADKLQSYADSITLVSRPEIHLIVFYTDWKIANITLITNWDGLKNLIIRLIKKGFV